MGKLVAKPLSTQTTTTRPMKSLFKTKRHRTKKISMIRKRTMEDALETPIGKLPASSKCLIK